MKAFLRRLRPDHLAGQIALLILAAIVMFHLTLTTIQHFTNPDGRPPIIEPSEFIASALLAIDAAPVSERSDVLAALARAAPWANFAVRDQPGDIPAVGASADLDVLRSRLWAGARVVAASRATDNRGGAIVVALRNGGYAVATTLEPRRSLWASMSSTQNGAPTLPMRLLERSALFFFLCASILTVWISSAVVAPLVKLAREAERYPAENAHLRPIAEAGPREVRDLTRALNRMQSRIEAMIEARSQALAAISHDLRTIITRVRLRSEFIADVELKEKMLHDAGLMDSMLYKNLQHLRDAKSAPDRGLIDLDSVLQTVSDQFADLGHDVTYRGGQHQIILGSLTEMQRVFNNLVENAVTYAKKVVITLDQPSPEVIRVDVADDGPGIGAESKQRVLEPFVRGEPARNMNDHSGFGLGLSIVRSLVEDVGGGLQLLDHEPHGLIARVTLPRAFAKE
ncbi:MAG: ATP-binding protein [Methylocystis sp.]|jgi:signal transduction histidine kinase